MKLYRREHFHMVLAVGIFQKLLTGFYFMHQKKLYGINNFLNMMKAINKNYRKQDSIGKYCTQPLTGGKAGGPDAYKEWKGALPSSGRAWAPPKRTSFPANVNLPSNYEELSILKKLDTLDDLNLVTWTKNGVPRYKMYLAASKGKAMNDIFEDVPPLSAASVEKTGYPTQKPLELIRRLILSST